MATLELRLNYRTVAARCIFWLMTLSSPIWFLLPLFVGICKFFSDRGFFEHMPAYEHAYIVQIMGMLGEGWLPMLIVSSSLWLALKEQRLLLNQQGILFPVFTLVDLLGRKDRAWHELLEVRILKPQDGADYRIQELQFIFKDAAVKVPLKSFTAANLEQMLLAIETFSPEQTKGLDSLHELKDLIKFELTSDGSKTYTSIWEDELRYRYSSTTFIPLSPGAQLQGGKIKVIRQLGFGGLSAIYLAQQEKKNLAILKESVLPSDVEATLKAKAEEQFKREALLLASLNHKQIARVLDYFVERAHYLLLEYVHGQDLRRYVGEQGALPEKRVLLIAMQITAILRYLHERETPIIHRDLTPENLIIADNGKIVLIDFGAANEFLHTATGTLVGKHAYMAPEQLKGRACTQSDLYSLGATLYFLLTGHDPLPLSESRPKAANAALSDELDALLADLTRLNKDERIQSASDLESRLKACWEQVNEQP